MHNDDNLHEYEEMKRRHKANGDDEPAIDLGEWNAGIDPGVIPPRGWLLGNQFCRRFVSSLIGTGAVGKTSLRIAQALSLTSGREITRQHVFVRSRVLYCCLEDDKDELERRIKAALLHHKISRADIDGWLFLATPRR